MTNRTATRLHRAATVSAAAALCLASFSAFAQGQDACRALAGTYVTSVSDIEGVFSSRGLMSFSTDGVFLMSDSAQAGLPGVYDPFGSAQGSWRCLGAEGDRLDASAVGLNFVLPGEGRPAVFGRVDYRVTLDAKTGSLSGNAELSFTTEGDLEGADPVKRPGPVLEKFQLEGRPVVARGE
jgi:hypothetical protein